MSRIVVVGLRLHHVIVPKLNTQHMTYPWRDHSSEYWCTGNGVYFDVRIFVEEAY